MNHTDIARVCHQINRAYCQALGDFSQPEWKDAPQWQKDSAIAGVQFHLANRYAGPQGSHESWLAQKEKDGWKYGPIKDAEKKEHPCIRPFHELPKEQQAKDYLFRETVLSLEPWLDENQPQMAEDPAVSNTDDIDDRAVAIARAAGVIPEAGVIPTQEAMAIPDSEDLAAKRQHIRDLVFNTIEQCSNEMLDDIEVVFTVEPKPDGTNE